MKVKVKASFDVNHRINISTLRLTSCDASLIAFGEARVTLKIIKKRGNRSSRFSEFVELF